MAITELADFPPKVDLLTKVYQPLPKLTAVVDWDALDASATAEEVLRSFSKALDRADKIGLGDILLARQSYWRDTLAITSHLRTFKDRNIIATVLTELNRQRRINGIAIIPRTAQTVVASETLVSSSALVSPDLAFV
jgi:hypothetical protein